jgi:ABC-type lipoprotein export system ATPase subunit
MQDVLEVKDVSKTFKTKAGTVNAVDKVSLRARKGNVTVIVGPSGSGKTTLLYIIGSLESPDSGEM